MTGGLLHHSIKWSLKPLKPLHTRAKSHDHEIFQSPKESIQRPSQDTSQIMYYGHEPSSVVWNCMWMDLNQMLFQWNFIHEDPHTWKHRLNQRLWAFGVPWFPNILFKNLLYKGGFEKRLTGHETWSILCHVGIHVDFTSILHSHTLLVPQV